LLQRDGIAHGIPFAVIVEVDEHVAFHALPLSDAVCPPAKVGIWERSGTQMMRVRPVEPHAHDPRGRSEHAR
jgi:hypothetical protein